MEILIKVGQLVLSLSILIILHELGHFLPAKWFKTKVEKFYLFFDPWFELFKKKIGETEYGIGWLPLGGYVKIAGMIDESFDTDQMKEEPKPWEFRSKPAWQRLIIMLGGVTVNFLLGFFIYGMILWAWGEEYVPVKNLIYGVEPDSIGLKMGIQPGDNIVAVDTLQLERYNPNLLRAEIIINNARNITVERNGERVQLPVSEEIATALSKYENKNFNLYSPRVPFIVDNFSNKSPAEKAGIQKGDRIISLDGTPTPFFNDFFNLVVKNPKIETEITVQVERPKGGGGLDTLSIAILTGKDGKIGAGPVGLETLRKPYTFLEAMPAGVTKGINFLGTQIKAFGQMFKGKIKPQDSLGSFITIGSMFPETWEWETFWQMTAMLSLVLAFINLLPIPALDGGHVMFLLFEVLTGKKPSDKVMEISTMVGFVILISIMVFALGLDISRLF
jgi:regulator of sigma E protease